MRHVVRALVVLLVFGAVGACGARQSEETLVLVDDPVDEPADSPVIEEEEEGPLPPVETGVVEEEAGFEGESEETLGDE